MRNVHAIIIIILIILIIVNASLRLLRATPPQAVLFVTIGSAAPEPGTGIFQIGIFSPAD
jgi:hypothetical protein